MSRLHTSEVRLHPEPQSQLLSEPECSFGIHERLCFVVDEQ
jgi:hypothetical protein